MSLNLQLDSYRSNLKLSKKGDKMKIFDPIRKKFYVNQPEEIVRQLIIQYLIIEKNISINKIAIEKRIKVLGMEKRFDILVYNKKMEPRILIECKAPSVRINQKTIDQIAIYNIELQAPFLLLSNGLENHFFNIDFQSKEINILKQIPHKLELLKE